MADQDMTLLDARRLAGWRTDAVIDHVLEFATAATRQRDRAQPHFPGHNKAAKYIRRIAAR